MSSETSSLVSNKAAATLAVGCLAVTAGVFYLMHREQVKINKEDDTTFMDDETFGGMSDYESPDRVKRRHRPSGHKSDKRNPQADNLGGSRINNNGHGPESGVIYG